MSRDMEHLDMRRVIQRNAARVPGGGVSGEVKIRFGLFLLCFEWTWGSFGGVAAGARWGDPV